MATGLEEILEAYCTAATIPIIEDARQYEGNAPDGQDVFPIARGLTFRHQNVDRSAPGGGRYHQRAPLAGDLFIIKIYAMSDGTDGAETIMQAMLADLIKAVDTFNAANLTTYDYTHLHLPNLTDITIKGELDYKIAEFQLLGSMNTEVNYT